MIEENQKSESENLLLLKYLIELKNLGLEVNKKEDKVILSVRIKERTFIVQDFNLNLSVKKLIQTIINN